MNLTVFLLNIFYINIIIYILVLLSYIYLKDILIKRYLNIHHLPKKDAGNVKMRFLGWIGQYELYMLVFNIVPLIALGLMS